MSTVADVPLRALPPHSRVGELKKDFQVLEDFYRGPALASLTEPQRRDLQTLQADLKELRGLRRLCQVRPGDPPELFEAALEARRETERIQAEVDRIVSTYGGRQPGNLHTFECGGRYIADIHWRKPGVPRELAETGMVGLNYECRTYLDEPTLEVNASPVNAQGKEDLHYIQIRVCLPQADRKHAEAGITLGRSDGYRTTRFSGTDELHHSAEAKDERWTAAETAFARQVLTDVGLGWLVPTVCPHCR
ncbi:MAG: hypothetical protein AB1758_21830 [Candidatus Eremiobacterota bacterium]